MGNVKRHTVVYENKEPFPGTFIAPGAMKMKDGVEELFVVWGGFENPPIGKARDFERDKETGAISFNIHFFDPIHDDLHDEKSGVEFVIYATDLVEYHTTDTRIVLSADIRGIYGHAFPGYPSHKTQGS